MKNANTVVTLAVGDIKPYEDNPRRNAEAIEAVAKSISTFGFRQPLLLDASHVIICGHTRWFAAQKVGLKEVPCIVAEGMTEEQARLLRIVDNRTHEFAEWDLEKLRAEVQTLSIDSGLDDFCIETDWLASLGLGDIGGELEELFNKPKTGSKQAGAPKAKQTYVCENCGTEFEA